jgi:hypothetical protein
MWDRSPIMAVQMEANVIYHERTIDCLKGLILFHDLGMGTNPMHFDLERARQRPSRLFLGVLGCDL